jgi:hypothetical protein
MIESTQAKHLIVQTQAGIYIPPDIDNVLTANEQLNPQGQLRLRFIRAIRHAVTMSFAHPDTRVHGINDSEIKLRVDLCMDAFKEMYFDQQRSILQFIDVIPKVLIDALRMAKKAAGHVDDTVRPTAWKKATDEPIPSAKTSLEEDPKQDLAEGLEPKPAEDTETLKRIQELEDG